MKCLVLRLKSEVDNNRLPYYFQTVENTLSPTTHEIKIDDFDYLPSGNYMIYAYTEASLPRIEMDYVGLRYKSDNSIINNTDFSKNNKAICYQFNIETNIADETWLRIYVNTYDVDYSIMLKYYGTDIPFINLTNQEIVVNLGVNSLIKYHIGLPIGDYQMTLTRDSQIESDSYFSINNYNNQT